MTLGDVKVAYRQCMVYKWFICDLKLYYIGCMQVAIGQAYIHSVKFIGNFSDVFA